MNTGFPTAKPHDDSKALSAEDRAIFNKLYRSRRDAIRRTVDLFDGQVESTS